jgi:hypothetical protein
MWACGGALRACWLPVVAGSVYTGTARSPSQAHWNGNSMSGRGDATLTARPLIFAAWTAAYTVTAGRFVSTRRGKP